MELDYWAAYPKKISEVSFSHDANTVQTFTVTFSFRYWVNYFHR